MGIRLVYGCCFFLGVCWKQYLKCPRIYLPATGKSMSTSVVMTDGLNLDRLYVLTDAESDEPKRVEG